MFKEENSVVIFCNMHLIKQHILLFIQKLNKEYVPLLSSQKQWWRYYLKANFQTENSRDVSSSFFPKTQTQKEGFKFLNYFRFTGTTFLKNDHPWIPFRRTSWRTKFQHSVSYLPSILFRMFYVLVFFVETHVMILIFYKKNITMLWYCYID